MGYMDISWTFVCISTSIWSRQTFLINPYVFKKQVRKTKMYVIFRGDTKIEIWRINPIKMMCWYSGRRSIGWTEKYYKHGKILNWMISVKNSTEEMMVPSRTSYFWRINYMYRFIRLIRVYVRRWIIPIFGITLKKYTYELSNPDYSYMKTSQVLLGV